ncbi:MAG: hypothetical protein RR677_06055 [Acinetobacter sp.]
MNKVIFLVGLFLLSFGNANAQTKIDKCENVLTSGVYNEYLENICGFNGGVSDGFKETYSKNNCPDLVSTSKIKKLVADVSADTKKRYVAFGESEFCENNVDAYSDLSIAFKNGVNFFKENGFKQKKDIGVRK